MCVLPTGSVPSAVHAEVRITYSRTFDKVCSLITGYDIEPVLQTELETKLSELHRLWTLQGQPVLDRIYTHTGKRLPNGRHDVRLTLCAVPSSSLFGAIVNMRQALPKVASDPVPLRYKVAVIDHELLHRLLAGVDLSRSALLRMNSRESKRVRDHLHLFALLKLAMLDLGQAEAFEELVRIDDRLPEPAYRRAWAIVNASPESYRAYIAEVRRAD